MNRVIILKAFQHFILTRFNRGLFTKNDTKQRGKPGPADAWMKHRIELFKRFCLPSVTGQTCQDFTWLIFFDPNTPKSYFRSLEHLSSYKNFIPIFGGGFKKAILRHLAPETGFIITTRLDNDDALHVSAIHQIQNHFHFQNRLALNFPLGYRLANNRLFLVKHHSNPFLSLIEQVHRDALGNPEVFTVMAQKHGEISKLAPLRQLLAKPMWLQVIHGRNWKNQVGGKPLSLRFSQVKRQFGLGS